MVRLAGFAGSGSGSGDGSRAGALRFREEGGGRVDEAAATGPAAVADEPDGSEEEFAACRAADLVILFEDMSMKKNSMLLTLHNCAAVMKG